MNTNTSPLPKTTAVPSASPPNEKEMEMGANVQELTNTLQRVQADFENYQKRAQQEMNVHYSRGKASALKDMLAFADALDAASEKVGDEHKKGFENLRTQFQKILLQNGVRPMQALGKPFDPFSCECMLQGNDPAQEGDIVLEEIQKGYYFHDDVLRSAKVKVNKHDEKNVNDNQKTNQNGGEQT